MKHTKQLYAHFYKDMIGEWRWSLRSRNGKILADSGEGYIKLSSCEAAFFIVCVGKKDILYRKEKGAVK